MSAEDLYGVSGSSSSGSDDMENDIYSGAGSNYDWTWSPVSGVDDLGNALSTGSSSTNNFWNQLGRALLGTQGSNGMGAGLALGLGALAAALTRQQAPAVKQPEYKAAPVYNRALTAPMFPPQPAPQKSASGQNIYTPMKGMPLFFNPNPFQFDPTEAAKRYGPTPEQIAQGRAGYEAGLASLYKPMTISPITFKGASTVTGASGNDTVSGGNSTLTGGSGNDTVNSGNKLVTTPKTSPSDPIQAFRSSSEYQDFLKANEGGIGTMDMYDSPYFGPVSSGSYGGAQDQAYKDWYQKTYNAEAPIVYKTQSNQASDMSGLLNTVYGQNASAPVQGGASGGSVDDIMVGYNEGGDVYAAAGRYLEGPGDGMSDSITAQIDHGGGKTQPARLARGEFVVPADVVSDLGNGSSNAGAQKLYDMMKKIRKARHGTSKQPPAVKTDKAMPA